VLAAARALGSQPLGSQPVEQHDLVELIFHAKEDRIGPGRWKWREIVDRQSAQPEPDEQRSLLDPPGDAPRG
jgi:hypothetical protein